MGTLERSPGISRKSRVLYPSPGFLSSATWPSLPKKHYNGLIKFYLTICFYRNAALTKSVRSRTSQHASYSLLSAWPNTLYSSNPSSRPPKEKQSKVRGQGSVCQHIQFPLNFHQLTYFRKHCLWALWEISLTNINCLVKGHWFAKYMHPFIFAFGKLGSISKEFELLHAYNFKFTIFCTKSILSLWIMFGKPH